MNVLIVLVAAVVVNLFFDLTEGESVIYITVLFFLLGYLDDKKETKKSNVSVKVTIDEKEFSKLLTERK